MPGAGRGNGLWRSLVAHLLWEQGVAGSNPASPTGNSRADFGGFAAEPTPVGPPPADGAPTPSRAVPSPGPSRTGPQPHGRWKHPPCRPLLPQMGPQPHRGPYCYPDRLRRAADQPIRSPVSGSNEWGLRTATETRSPFRTVPGAGPGTEHDATEVDGHHVVRAEGLDARRRWRRRARRPGEDRSRSGHPPGGCRPRRVDPARVASAPAQARRRSEPATRAKPGGSTTTRAVIRPMSPVTSATSTVAGAAYTSPGLPTWMTRPAAITATRSPIAIASTGSLVT